MSTMRYGCGAENEGKVNTEVHRGDPSIFCMLCSCTTNTTDSQQRRAYRKQCQEGTGRVALLGNCSYTFWV